MSLWLKILLGTAGAVAAVLLLLALAVTLLIDPNDYRPLLVDAVQDATGREFEISGDLGLDVLPCCSVSVGPSRLGNPEGFAAAPDAGDFARIEGASASLKLWPLLTRRQIEIGMVTLDGLDLALIRRADGRDNWTFDDDAAPSGATGEESAGTTPELAVEGIRLSDSRIRYRDEAAGQDYRVAGIQVTTGAIRLGAAQASFPLDVSAALRDEAAGIDADLSLSARISLDGERITISDLAAALEGLDSRVDITGAGALAGEQMEFAGTLAVDSELRPVLRALTGVEPQLTDDSALRQLSARAHWQASATALAVDELELRLDDSRLSGHLAVDEFDSLSSRFDLTLDRLDADRYLAPEDSTSSSTPAPSGAEPTMLPLDALATLPVAGRLNIGSLIASGVEVADVTVQFDSAGGQVDTRVGARLAGGSLTLAGGGRVDAAEPELTGTLEVQGLSPRTLLTALDADSPTANPQALSRFEGSSRWRLTPSTFALTQMRWRLDDSNLSGTLRVVDFDTLPLRFNLVVDRMNVDDYLAPDGPDDSAAAADGAATEIPVETLRPLNLAGKFAAGELVLMGLTLTDVAAEVAARDGVLRLDPMSAALYGGSYRGSAVVDATGKQAAVTLDQQLSNVQASQALGQLFGIDALSGALSLKLSGSGTGNTSTDLLRGLAGGLSFDLTDGVYQGVDLVYELERAKARFKKEAAPEAPANPQTPIRSLAMQGEMHNGVLQTRALKAETRGLKLGGSGGINLLDLALDYQIDAEVLTQAASSLGLDEFAGLAVPLTLSGPISAPKVGVDVSSLASNALRATAERKLQDLLTDKLGGGASAGSGDTPAADGTAAPAAEATDSGKAAQTEEPASTRDVLKQGLRDLLDSRRKREDES